MSRRAASAPQRNQLISRGCIAVLFAGETEVRLRAGSCERSSETPKLCKSSEIRPAAASSAYRGTRAICRSDEGTEATYRARRSADDPCRLAGPYTLAVRPRPDVNRVFDDTGTDRLFSGLRTTRGSGQRYERLRQLSREGFPRRLPTSATTWMLSRFTTSIPERD